MYSLSIYINFLYIYLKSSPSGVNHKNLSKKCFTDTTEFEPAILPVAGTPYPLGHVCDVPGMSLHFSLFCDQLSRCVLCRSKIAGSSAVAEIKHVSMHFKTL